MSDFIVCVDPGSAEDEDRRMSMCFGKERYATPQQAHKIADRRNRRGKRQSVYKCPFCRMWHQGTSTPRRR